MLTQLFSNQATFTLLVNIVVTLTRFSARKEKKNPSRCRCGCTAGFPGTARSLAEEALNKGASLPLIGQETMGEWEEQKEGDEEEEQKECWLGGGRSFSVAH